MRDVLNAGIRLLVIALVASLLLAGTNMITRGPIAEHTREQTIAARLAVMPGADSFEPVEWPESIALTEFPSLVEVYEARSSGELIGYTFLYTPMGYKAEIPVSVGISLPETPGAPAFITGVTIGDISETSGLGSRIKDEAFLSQFRGVQSNLLNEDVDTISGATISSGAVKNAAKNAILAFDAIRLSAQPAQ
ncbi:electron transport complex subunit G [Clostridia bacterium]|nr:electron transport complex subunit G [Clostridia bacterium]